MKLLRNRNFRICLVVLLCTILILSFGGCSVLNEVGFRPNEEASGTSGSPFEGTGSGKAAEKNDGDSDLQKPIEGNPTKEEVPPARSGFHYESGELDNNEVYSATFYNEELLGEIRYDTGGLAKTSFPKFDVEYQKDFNTVYVRTPRDTITYHLHANRDVESVYENSNRLYGYEYSGENLSRITNYREGEAYCIGFDESGNAVNRTIYFYANGKYFLDDLKTYENLPDDIAERARVSIEEISAIQTEKTIRVGNVTRTVTVQDGTVVREVIEDGSISKEIVYINDFYRNKIGFILDGNRYYYLFNTVGDVTDVLTDTGAVAASYAYDNIGAALSVTGPQAEAIRNYNAFAYRARDDWYYNDAGKFYDVGGGVLYYAEYAKFRDLSGNDRTFGDFIKNPARYSIRNGQSVDANSKELFSDPEQRIRDKVIRQFSLGLENNGIKSTINIPAFDRETDILSYRADVFTSDNAYNRNHAVNGQAYLVCRNDAAGIACAKARLSELQLGKKYLVNCSASYIPARGVVSAKGHFIIDGTYVRFQSDPAGGGVVSYDAFPNTESNYDRSYGNLFNYDTGYYVYFDGNLSVDRNVALIGNLINEFDPDSVMQGVYQTLDEFANRVEIDNFEVQYLSPETLEEMERCARGNLILNGMTYDEIVRQYGEDDLEFTFVDGKLVQTSTLPKEDPVDWKNFFIKLGVGVGVILIATTVTVVTGGTAAPVMCFLATSAELAAASVVGGAVGAAVEYAVTGDKNKALSGFADGFCFTALISSAATVSGVVPSFCFPAGTPVHTFNGILPIENIKVGDSVLSYNEAKGRNEYQQVLRLFPNATEELISIDIDGDVIEATPRHPFYLKNLGWVRANELKPGNSVLMKDGSGGIVRSVEKIDKSVPVYNFEVEGNHDYYVGEKGFLVHNAGCGATASGELAGTSAVEKVIAGSVIAGGAIAVGVGTGIAIKESVTLSSYQQRIEARNKRIVKQVNEKKRKQPNSPPIYFEINIAGGNYEMAENEVSNEFIGYTLYEARLGILEGKSYTTACQSDALILIETAFPGFEILHHPLHYQPSLDGQTTYKVNGHAVHSYYVALDLGA